MTEFLTWNQWIPPTQWQSIKTVPGFVVMIFVVWVIASIVTNILDKYC